MQPKAYLVQGEVDATLTRKRKRMEHVQQGWKSNCSEENGNKNNMQIQISA